MSASPRVRVATATLGGVALAGMLTGCATASATGSTITGPYTDGTYTATGDYVSPGGPESLGVTLTLKSDVVTDVQITPRPNDSTAQFYQASFAAGIAAEVVGKDLDSLDVHRVGGSSLTSQGFDDAVQKIKAEAHG